MSDLKNATVPLAAGKQAAGAWMLPGLTLGLFLPLLFSRSIAYYPAVFIYSIPAGLVLLYAVFRSLLHVIARHVPSPAEARERVAAVLSPLVLLNFSAVVFIFPVPAIPF